MVNVVRSPGTIRNFTGDSNHTVSRVGPCVLAYLNYYGLYLSADAITKHLCLFLHLALALFRHLVLRQRMLDPLLQILQCSLAPTVDLALFDLWRMVRLTLFQDTHGYWFLVVVYWFVTPR